VLLFTSASDNVEIQTVIEGGRMPDFTDERLRPIVEPA